MSTSVLPVADRHVVLPAPTVTILRPSLARIDFGDVATTHVSQVFGAGDSNTKLRKSGGQGFLTIGFSMAPHWLGGLGNVCGASSVGCRGGCLHSCGLASVWDNIKIGRLARKALWFLEREWLLDRMNHEIRRESAKARFEGLRLAVRPNVLSDIPWEKFGLIDAHPDVQFYDYSKWVGRAGLVRPNYWVTFSRSEVNEADCLRLLSQRKNVAIPFHNVGGGYVGNRAKFQTLPKRWKGFDVVDGDSTDLRFLDPRGRSRGGKVIGLRLKAPTTAQRDNVIASGFSVEYCAA